MTAGGRATRDGGRATPVPVIGITTYPADEGGRVSLPREYVDAVRRAGGRAVLVAPGDQDPPGLLDELDGVVLAGGGDVDPSAYGHMRHDTTYQTDRERDATELALVDGLMATGTPTLAICRGLQILNVALGGTLHPHLPDRFGDAVAHRAPPREPTPHAVTVEPGSLVAQLMGSREVVPMSWHHQAADRLGEGLRATAHAPDGVVEAVEHEDHPWLAAVQWHPELTAAGDPSQQQLFDGLVRAAASRRSTRDSPEPRDPARTG